MKLSKTYSNEGALAHIDTPKHYYGVNINGHPIVILIEDKDTYGAFELIDAPHLETDEEGKLRQKLNLTNIDDKEVAGYAILLLEALLAHLEEEE